MQPQSTSDSQPVQRADTIPVKLKKVKSHEPPMPQKPEPNRVKTAQGSVRNISASTYKPDRKPPSPPKPADEAPTQGPTQADPSQASQNFFPFGQMDAEQASRF